jgi:tripartite-type tricarboxylate transporter receptor subunit TctC
MRIAPLLGAAALCLATAAAAQYPSRPVRIVVPFNPGGGAPDVTARLLAEQLTPALGQPVVVENRPGSNGNIAAEHVARSAADGHTLLLGHDSLFLINPHLYARMPLDVHRELVAVSPLVRSTFVLAVNPRLGAASLPEFVELARRSNPSLAYASTGNGSQHHLLMERLRRRAGIELLHVPYRSGAAGATAAGEVAATFASAGSIAPLVRAERLRALAVSSAERSAFFPDVPSIAEFYPGFEMRAWVALFAPAQTPREIVLRLRDEVHARFFADAGILRRLRDAAGLEPMVLAPAQFEESVRSDREAYGELVRQLGLKIE